MFGSKARKIDKLEREIGRLEEECSYYRGNVKYWEEKFKNLKQRLQNHYCNHKGCIELKASFKSSVPQSHSFATPRYSDNYEVFCKDCGKTFLSTRVLPHAKKCQERLEKEVADEPQEETVKETKPSLSTVREATLDILNNAIKAENGNLASQLAGVYRGLTSIAKESPIDD